MIAPQHFTNEMNGVLDFANSFHSCKIGKKYGMGVADIKAAAKKVIRRKR